MLSGSKEEAEGLIRSVITRLSGKLTHLSSSAGQMVNTLANQNVTQNVNDRSPSVANTKGAFFAGANDTDPKTNVTLDHEQEQEVSNVSSPAPGGSSSGE